MRFILLMLLWLSTLHAVYAQSIEIMPGTKRLFADVQWLKPFDQQYRWTLFSRTRATTDYSGENPNIFSGVYLNYTTTSGIGATILGRIATGSSGTDVGIHFFKAREQLLIYALASVELRNQLAYSWFSILRFTPSINENWKWYSSLELYSYFFKGSHVASVQRLRLGADYQGYQFGLALNLSGTGSKYEQTDTNPGLFLRKQF